MRGERFESPEAAVETFRTLISEITVLEWKKMLRKLIRAYAKINLKGEYFEKQYKAIYQILLTEIPQLSCASSINWNVTVLSF